MDKPHGPALIRLIDSRKKSLTVNELEWMLGSARGILEREQGKTNVS